MPFDSIASIQMPLQVVLRDAVIQAIRLLLDNSTRTNYPTLTRPDHDAATLGLKVARHCPANWDEVENCR
ncbi:hypothetical protein SAMN05518866_107183 [Sphingobium sp. YR768]|nr:hypothetical protein SAMN05518866_107183 [Sphingobium sp. YR768]